MEIPVPFSMVVSGQSGCGKTYFIYQLLKSLKMPITYAYTEYQDLYKTMSDEFSDIKFVEGLPSEEDIKPNSIIVLDDIMLLLGKEVAKMFTRMRHRNVSPIITLQNLFFPNQYTRTVTMNAKYMVLFPSPRDVGMIKRIGLQMFPEKPKYIISAFKQATAKPYGYLFLDLSPNAEHRVLTGVLPSQELFAFVPTA